MYEYIYILLVQKRGSSLLSPQSLTLSQYLFSGTHLVLVHVNSDMEQLVLGPNWPDLLFPLVLMLLMLAGSALADVIDTVIEQMICISMAVAIMKLAAGHGDFVGAAKYKCKYLVWVKINVGSAESVGTELQHTGLYN